MSRRNYAIARKSGRSGVLASWALLFGVALAVAAGQDAQAEEPLKLKAEAPADQLVVGGKLGGFYYAARPLKEEYDKLLQRVQTLRAEIGSRKISSQAATARVHKLQAELQKVRQLIEESKTFVAAGKLVTKTETTEFALGPEELLFVSGVARVRLVGWDEPHVKCVLEKTVISDGKQPLDEHFAGIRLVRRHGPAKELVGRSAAENQADEIAFLASPDGKQLTPEQLQTRAAWMAKASAYHSFFRPFQARPIDCLELEGLTYPQGNRQVQYEVLSPKGNGHSGSMWQRHASLTIYAPSCKGVGVLGGMGGLEVDKLKAPLFVRGDGDQDYNSHSHVKDHEGTLTVENIQLETITNVRGDVSITVSEDLGNSGTEYQDGNETEYTEAPASYDYRNIQGNFTAQLLKINLQFSEVSGRIDVTNQFGDTQFTARAPLAAVAHRVVSESGAVTLQLAKEALKDAPLVAATECGAVRAMQNAPPLVSGNIGFWADNGSLRREFRGFVTKREAQPPNDGFARFEPFQRMESIFNPEEKLTPGLDVLSRAGTVQIEPIAE